MTLETKNCWYELNIPSENALSPSFKFPDVTGREFGVWGYKSLDIFSYDWLKHLYKNNLVISEALLFYRAPGHNTEFAHLDIHRNHPVQVSTFAINMIIGGEDAYMTWYDMPPINYKPTQGPAGSVYYNWPIDTLTEIDRHVLSKDKLTLVRVGIPHTVIMGDQPRWCISARGNTSFNTMYWKEVTEWMREKKFLIERDQNV